MNPTSSRAARTGGLATVVLAALLCVTACTSSSQADAAAGTATTTPSGAPSTADRQAALQAYAQCMRTNGVTDFPDPAADPSGASPPAQRQPTTDNATLQKARAACQDKRPARQPLTAEQQAQRQKDMVKYATCMRSNGIDLPDPPADGAQQPPSPGATPAFDRNDPKFAKADQACRPKPTGATQ